MESTITTNNRQKISENFRAMGTDVSVDIVTDDRELAEKSIAEVKNIFAQNEKIFSRFRPDSELAKINEAIGHAVSVSPGMLAVLKLCLKFNGLSEGYFDPRVIGNLEKIGYDRDFKTNDFNTEEFRKVELEKIEGKLEDDLIIDPAEETVLVKKKIDTTGIAKGYTVDRAADFLKRQKFENFVVDAGGDMFASGLDENDKAWSIGVEGLEEGKIMLRLENEGIATSGISRKRWTIGDKKFHHLINPKDPENFSYDIKTVTVIEDKTVEADGRAKVLVLMGREKGLEFANRNKLKALFLDYKGNVYLSEKIKEHLIKNLV